MVIKTNLFKKGRRWRKELCVKEKRRVYLDLFNHKQKGDTPMRVAKELVIEPAQSWARLQEAKGSEWFVPTWRSN